MSDLKLKAIRITHPGEVDINGDVVPMETDNSLREFYSHVTRGYQFLEKKLGGKALFFYLRYQNTFNVLPDFIDPLMFPQETLLTEFFVPNNSLIYYSKKWETGPMLDGPVTFDIDENRLDCPEYQKLIEDDWENIFITKTNIYLNQEDLEGVCKRIPRDNIIRQYKMRGG